MGAIFMGVDPGLVHTGVVAFAFYEGRRHLLTNSWVIDGPDAAAVAAAVQVWKPDHVFIEAYRPRSHYSTDARMGRAVNEIKAAVPGSKTIDNTGVKKVIRPALMRAMDVWNFTQSTHHQDLRAAARIGLYGAVKDSDMNAVIYKFMDDYLNGDPWTQG